jgi:hypothetical protein
MRFVHHLRSRASVVALSAAVMFTGCGEPISAPSLDPAFSRNERRDDGVLFKGRGTGQDVSITFEAAGVHIIAQATGTATGVGKFTEVLDYTLSYDLVTFGGGATITGKNGDKIFLTFTGTIPGFANQVFPLPYHVTYTLTGGTGRMRGASGQGTLEGIDFGAGAFAFEFSGGRVRGEDD